jgi:hypothetical protein
MKTINRQNLLLCLCILFWTCSEKSPLEIEHHVLDTPNSSPIIEESNYTDGTDFTEGYYNGKIRSNQVNLEWEASKDENFLAYKIFRALGGGPDVEDIFEGFEGGSFPSGWTEYGDYGGWYVTSEDAALGDYSIRSYSGYYSYEYLEKTITVPQNSDIFISYYSMGMYDGEGYLYINGSLHDFWGYNYDGPYWNYNSNYYYTGSNTEIILTWIYLTESSGYGLLDNIEISGVDGGSTSYSLIETLNDKNTSTFLDTTLIQNQYYTYKVATIIEQGTHKVDDVEIKTPLWQAPSNINYDILSPEVIEVTWEDNSESESSFKVYVEESYYWNDYETVNSYSSSQDDTSMVISNLSTDTQYRIGVKAYNSWEETDTTYSNSFTISFDPPTYLNVSAVSDTEAVYLTWNDNTNLENGFKIQRKIDFDGVYETIGYSGEDENYFTDYINFEDFKFDTSFVYQVCAYNTYSDTVFTDYSYYDSYIFTLSSPSNFSANQQSGSKLVDLTWTDNLTIEDGFEIERDIGTGFELLETLSANTTSYTDTDTTSFEYDSTYIYRIRAYNDYSGTIYTDYSNEAFIILSEISEFSLQFTNCGSTGRYGPSQSEVNNTYSGTELEGQVTVSNGIQYWIVPYTGTYTIEVKGADGGKTTYYNYQGGEGAYMSGDFELIAGETIKILVGQAGQTVYIASGGGGGSFVVSNTNEPLIIAGGGGGIRYNSNNYYESGTTSNNGQRSQASNNGGTNGNGGGGYYNGGSGGGGFYSDGGDGYSSCSPGLSFLYGNGVGGDNYNSNGGEGGFGSGGGAEGYYNHGAGGGGGYSGGGGYNGSAGGGGSYNVGNNQNNSNGSYEGSENHGYVIIRNY